MEDAIEAGLEVAQQRVDPAELRHLASGSQVLSGPGADCF